VSGLHYINQNQVHKPFFHIPVYIKNIAAFAYPQPDSEKLDLVKTCFGKLSHKFDKIIDKGNSCP